MRPIKKALARKFPALLPLLLFAACGGSPTGTETALMALSVTPSNPVTAQPSTAAGFAWNVAFTLTVKETQGTGVTITTITATVREVVGGVLTGGAVTQNTTVSAAGQKVAGRGSAAFPMAVDFTLPAGGRTAVVDLVVVAKDDNSTAVASSYEVAVN